MAENLDSLGFLGTNLLQAATKKLLRDIDRLSTNQNTIPFSAVATQAVPVQGGNKTFASVPPGSAWNWQPQQAPQVPTPTETTQSTTQTTQSQPRLAAASAAIGGIAAATIAYGQSKLSPQLGLNALQVQSELGSAPGMTNAASFTQTRIAALGTGGGSGQIFAQNTTDALMGYSTLQQIAGQSNVGASLLGRAATQEMGAAEYTSPGMSMKQAANVSAWLYNPMTSYRMLQMGYPIQPRRIGANNAAHPNTPAAVTAGMLLKYGNGRIPKPSTLRANMANGQIVSRNLNAIGAPPGFGGEMLAMDQLFYGGPSGTLKPMKVNQVSQDFSTLTSTTTTASQKQAVENQLAKYGVTKSEVSSIQTANAVGGESVSDQSSAFAQTLKATTNTLTTLETKISATLKSSGADTALGHVGGTTGALSSNLGNSGTKASGGGWMADIGKFTHDIFGAVANVRGGGAASTSGYDMGNLLKVGEYLMAHGYSRVGAAGITGCIAGESGGNPESSGSGGDGLIGWTPPSTGPALTGNAAKDLVTQEAAIVTYNNAQGATAIKTLNDEPNAVAAADYYSQTFERPAVTDSDVRSSVANQIYSELSGASTSNGSTGSSTITSDISGQTGGLSAPLLGGESSQVTTETAMVLGAQTGGIAAGSGFYGEKGGVSAGFGSLTDFGGSAAPTSAAASNGGGSTPTSSSPTGTSTSSGGGTSGYDMANLLSVAKYMMAHGYTRYAASGMAACIAGESGGNPESSGSGGDGLIGWTPPSTGPALTGNAAADLLTQEAAIVTYNQGQGTAAIAELNAATSVVSAADIYSQVFERPAVTDSDVRSAVGTTIYSELAGVTETGSATGGATTTKTSGATSAGSSTAPGQAQQTSVHALEMGSTGLNLGTGDTAAMGSESELEATEAALGGGINVMGSLGSFGITIGGAGSTATASGGSAGGAKAVAAYAETFAAGTQYPYVSDGSSPSGWDCTGFACYVYYHFGMDFPDFKPGVDHPFGCAVMWASSFLKHTSTPEVGGMLFEAGADGTVASPGHVGIITSTNPLQMVAAADTAEGTVFETPTQISGYTVPAAGFSTTAPSISTTGTLASGTGTATSSSKATSVNPSAAGGYACCGQLLQVGERGPELVVDATAHQLSASLAQATQAKNLSLDIEKNEIELTLPPNTDLSDTDKVGETLANMLVNEIAANAKVRRAISA